MFGAWFGAWFGGIVGAIISPVIMYYIVYIYPKDALCAIPLWVEAPIPSLSYYLTNNFPFLIAFTGLILGFLIGWGIHSLIRRYS